MADSLIFIEQAGYASDLCVEGTRSKIWPVHQLPSLRIAVILLGHSS
jgi:hypothetical protein